VEIGIRYSDDRPGTMTIGQLGNGELLYRIVTPRSGIPHSVAEGYERPVACSQQNHRRTANLADAV